MVFKQLKSKWSYKSVSKSNLSCKSILIFVASQVGKFENRVQAESTPLLQDVQNFIIALKYYNSEDAQVETDSLKWLQSVSVYRYIY